jgi:hypothetical protein
VNDVDGLNRFINHVLSAVFMILAAYLFYDGALIDAAFTLGFALVYAVLAAAYPPASGS